MAVTQVNGHVLIPHVPNWREPVSWGRTWETAVPSAVTGKDERHAHRARPLISLSCLLTGLNIQEQTQIEDRIRAAMKSGKAAVPAWGRGVVMATASSGATFTIAESSYVPSVGDYLFFIDPFAPQNFETGVVQSWNAGSRTVTLTGALSRVYQANSIVWPLLFGRIVPDRGTDLSPDISERTLNFREDKSTDAIGIGGTVNNGSITSPSYRGRPILDTPANWQRSPVREFSFDLRDEVIGFGQARYQATQEHVVHGFEFDLLLESDADIALFDSLTGDTLAGRSGTFWLPGTVAACEIVSGLSTTQFQVLDQNLTLSFADVPELHLYFTKDGVSMSSKVAAVTNIGGGLERITVNAPLPFAPDQSWAVVRLSLCRLADDTERGVFYEENMQSRVVRVVEVPNDYADLGHISHWNLDEATGTGSRLDSLGPNHLSAFNSVGGLGAKFGLGAAQMDSGHYLHVASNPTLQASLSGFGVTAWVSMNNKFGSGQVAISKFTDGVGTEYSIHFDTASDRLQFRTNFNGSEVSVVASNFGSPPTFTLFFVACWYDPVAGKIFIQVNGGTPNEAAVTGSPLIGTGAFMIGKYDAAGIGTSWSGIVDHVDYFQRSLSATERDFLYNAGAGRVFPYLAHSKPRWLYRFSVDDPEHAGWRFTSDERNYFDGSYTWTARPITHSGFKRSIKLDREDVKITAHYDDGAPFTLWFPYPPSFRVNVEIFEEIAGVKTLHFTGFILGVELKGKTVEAACVTWLAQLDRKAPRVMFQPRCNNWLFDVACGVSRVSKQVTGTIVSITDGVLVRVNLSPFTTADPNYFNRGEIHFSYLSTASFESRSIVKGVFVSGSTWDLTLNLPFKSAAASSSIIAYPGCDGLLATCETKFANKARFAGFPYIPQINPTIKPVTRKTVSPKK